MKIINHGVDGIIIDHSNNELLENYLTLLSDIPKMKMLGNKARESIKDSLTWQHCAKHLVSLINVG